MAKEDDGEALCEWSSLARNAGNRRRWADLAEEELTYARIEEQMDDEEITRQAPQNFFVSEHMDFTPDTHASYPWGRSSPAPRDPVMTKAEAKLTKLQHEMWRLEHQSIEPIWTDSKSKSSRSSATLLTSTSASSGLSEEPDAHTESYMSAEQHVQPRRGFPRHVDSVNHGTDIPTIPVDENGQLTSIGSAAHFRKTCTPCLFFSTESGCQNGTNCRFCHIVHTRQVKMRPCKNKRDRYKQLISRVKQEIETDPHAFNRDEVKLLPSIEVRTELRDKIMTSLCAHVQEVKAREGHEDAPAPHSLSACDEAVMAAPWIGKPAGPGDTTRVIL